MNRQLRSLRVLRTPRSRRATAPKGFAQVPGVTGAFTRIVPGAVKPTGPNLVGLRKAAAAKRRTPKHRNKHLVHAKRAKLAKPTKLG